MHLTHRCYSKRFVCPSHPDPRWLSFAHEYSTLTSRSVTIRHSDYRRETRYIRGNGILTVRKNRIKIFSAEPGAHDCAARLFFSPLYPVLPVLHFTLSVNPDTVS